LGERTVCIPIEPGEEACVIEGPDRPTLGFDLDSAIARLEDERWAEEMRSLTQRLPFAYDRLPWALRGLGAVAVFTPQRVLRVLRTRQEPGWPVAPALDVLRALRGDPVLPGWREATWGFVVTCDVDSPAGWRRALAVADTVEEVGMRAAFFVVGEVLASAPEIGHELVARGHEIGSHDVRHDNRLTTLAVPALHDRLAAARESVAPYGGVGFRSPSLLRSPRLLGAVAQHFDYDSSVCDTDLECSRGVTTVRPYMLRGGVVLPITLPMDSSLRFTLHGKEAISAIWREKCEWIRALGGLATLAIHAEPQLSGGKAFRRIVAEFLAWIRAHDDVEVLLPREVATRTAQLSRHPAPPRGE
jgi:peptidoglycan/xylan/chitin deacetylase (PgdA/CDA1 family)